MTIEQAMRKMKHLVEPAEETVRDLLTDGYHIIAGDIDDFDNIAVKYDLFVVDGILFAAKMSDSTPEKTVLTPEHAAHFTHDYFHMLWSNYLITKDVFFVDTIGYLKKSMLRGISIDRVKNELTHQKEVLFFEAPSKG